MPRRIYAVPEIRRLGPGGVADAALTAGAAATAPPPSSPPAGTISHNDLADVWPDQHHAQGHLMSSLSDHPDYEAWLSSLATLTGGLGGMVPYEMVDGETFTVPVRKQALFTETILVAAGALLVVDGHLLEVA